VAEVVPEEFPPSKCDNREALTNDSLDSDSLTPTCQNPSTICGAEILTSRRYVREC
jgi:hypothetical protein